MPYKECKMITNYSIWTSQKSDIGFVNGEPFYIPTSQLWDGYEMQDNCYTWRQDSTKNVRYIEFVDGNYCIVEYAYVKNPTIPSTFELVQVDRIILSDVKIEPFIPELNKVNKTVYFPMNDPENIAMNDQAMLRMTQRT